MHNPHPHPDTTPNPNTSCLRVVEISFLCVRPYPNPDTLSSILTSILTSTLTNRYPLKQYVEFLPLMVDWLRGSIEEMNTRPKEIVKPDEIEMMDELNKAVEGVMNGIAELYPVAYVSVREGGFSSNDTSPASSPSNNKTNNRSALVLLAGKCLQASETLKTCVNACRVSCMVACDHSSPYLLDRLSHQLHLTMIACDHSPPSK